MNTTTYSFILTILAGLSTMIGMLAIFIKKKNQNKIIVSSLAFAVGVMITVSITDLIPESISLLNKNLSTISTILLCVLGMILGIILSMIIDYYLPDKPLSKTNDKSLFKIVIISIIAIIMHNIPENCSCYVS